MQDGKIKGISQPLAVTINPFTSIEEERNQWLLYQERDIEEVEGKTIAAVDHRSMLSAVKEGPQTFTNEQKYKRQS